MSEPRESEPIRGTQGNNVRCRLVFIDDQDNDSVLMRVTVEPSGDVLEERVPRDAAAAKSQTLDNDVIDAKLTDLLAPYDTRSS